MARAPKPPRDTLKVRRLPAVGDEITVKVRVTRLGRNSYDTADTITVRLPGHETPVTVAASSILPEDE